MIARHEPVFKDAKTRADAYAAVFTGVVGELVLEDMKRTYHYYATTFDANPQVAAYKEGTRAVVVAIDNLVLVAPHMPTPPPDEDEENEDPDGE